MSAISEQHEWNTQKRQGKSLTFFMFLDFHRQNQNLLCLLVSNNVCLELVFFPTVFQVLEFIYKSVRLEILKTKNVKVCELQ